MQGYILALKPLKGHMVMEKKKAERKIIAFAFSRNCFAFSKKTLHETRTHIGNDRFCDILT